MRFACLTILSIFFMWSAYQLTFMVVDRAHDMGPHLLALISIILAVTVAFRRTP